MSVIVLNQLVGPPLLERALRGAGEHNAYEHVTEVCHRSESVSSAVRRTSRSLDSPPLCTSGGVASGLSSESPPASPRRVVPAEGEEDG